jgi:foldase protein PrsA
LGLLSRLRATRRRTATFGLVALVVLGAAMLSACGSSSSTLPSGVVAQVGDTQITRAQLDTYMSQLAASATAQGQAFPTPGTASYRTAQQQALQQLIQLQIVGFEAGKCGKPCAVSNAAISAQLDTLAKQRFGGSHVKLAAYLRSLDFTLDQARDQVKAGLEQQKLQTYVERGVTFTPADAKAYYAANAAQFNVPETRTVSHILVASQALANTIRAEVTPANFAALARQYSTDTGSKAQGGALGSIRASEVVAPFAKAAFALKVGQISQPVHSQFGWHIIYVTKITPAHHTSEAAAVPGIISSQLTSKRTTAYQQWVTKTLAYWNAQTKYASSSLTPPTPASGASPAG